LEFGQTKKTHQHRKSLILATGAHAFSMGTKAYRYSGIFSSYKRKAGENLLLLILDDSLY